MTDSLLKRIERGGRALLVWLTAVLLRARRRPIDLSAAPRILVVRLDERVGNLLLSIPLLNSLVRRFPAGEIHLLASVKGQGLLEGHPAVTRFIPFRKKVLFAADGPLRTPWRLRRARYDLVIDAANPTDPSTTQALLVRFAGARHSVGPAHGPFTRLYSAPASIKDAGPHEIDLRLALLRPIPGENVSREMTLGAVAHAAVSGPTLKLLESLHGTFWIALNLGARLSSKTLPASSYAAIATLASDSGLGVVITYGPKEADLAGEVAAAAAASTLAPETTLIDLAALFGHARAVISCDTGPMHLAVATGTPTCGIFLSTPAERYGHAGPPHHVIDVQSAHPEEWIEDLERWLAEQRPAS